MNAPPDSQATFDASGSDTLQTIDMDQYPAGPYTLRITGTVGNKSDYTEIIVTFVDPCIDAVLTIEDPDPFEDEDYVLRQP